MWGRGGAHDEGDNRTERSLEKDAGSALVNASPSPLSPQPCDTGGCLRFFMRRSRLTVLGGTSSTCHCLFELLQGREHVALGLSDRGRHFQAEKGATNLITFEKQMMMIHQ